ncbi:MAG: hypothetical protein FH761_08910 [Firmicutes bacterium]|nr:hypothetical protein [Bacillota bacterium]
MKYIFEKERKNYEDFASGHVLYNRKGATSFPVRLASEIFLRSKNYLEEKGNNGKITIYDPCCGGAYLLTTLGFLYGKSFSKIMASDINEEMISLAARNLSLLTEEGMENRIEEIKGYIEEFGKSSHKKALNSGIRLKEMLGGLDKSTTVECFKKDALNNKGISNSVDLIMTDIPYGNLVEWSGDEGNSLEQFLNSMLLNLKPDSIMTIITDKKEIIKHKGYNRIKHFTIGKRRVSFLEPIYN